MFQPTQLVFDVSGLLVKLATGLGRHGSGLLTGGSAGGAASKIPATGKILFRAHIDDQFQRQQVADLSVKKDDPLPNCAVISGNILQNAPEPALPQAAVVGSGADDSVAPVAIVSGSLRKTIYAVNGKPPAPPLPPLIAPGDEVTFQLTLPIPSTDAAALSFDDFLPLPVFHVGTFAQPVNSCAGAPTLFAPNTTETLGSLCKYLLGSGLPILTPSAAANSLHFEYGTLTDPKNRPRPVNLGFTLQASAEPFADGLHLTNHVIEREKSTFGVESDQTEVAELVLGQPKLRIRKGVVATNNHRAVFSPSPPAPQGVTFNLNRPGKPPAFSGVINSDNVGTALNSDVSNIEGCDLVRSAIAVENLGSSPRGAFNVRVADLLPSCLRPLFGHFFNLQVVNGNRVPFTCNGGQRCPDLAGLFFGSGITLDDRPGAGALAPYSPTGGDNIAIITFDARIPCNVPATGCCTNTAKLLGYAGVEHGPNHTLATFSIPFPDTASPFADSAQICIQPRLAKSIASTSEAHTGPSAAGEQLAIGEVVRYHLEVEVPDGVSPEMTLLDVLPSGLIWLPGLCSVTVDPALTTSIHPGQVISSNGTGLTIQFGTVKNQSTNLIDPDVKPELIAVECAALVLNSLGSTAVNHQGELKRNSFSVQLQPSAGPSVTFNSNAVQAIIAEPAGSLVKQEIAAVAPADASYLLSYTNTGTASAFDILVEDAPPTPLVLVPGSVTASGGCTVDPGPLARGQVRVSCGVVPPGGTVNVRFGASGIPLCQQVANLATLTYTSLPGDHGTSAPGASGQPNGERIYRSTASAVTSRCPDLTIQKTHAGNFTCGQNGTYALNVSNAGNAPAVPPEVVHDTLPGGLTFVSGGGSGWRCTAAGAVVTCANAAAILPGASSAFTLTVTASCQAGGMPPPVTNCATVTTSPEINLGNNQSCDPTSFAAAPGCVVAIAAGGAHSLAVRRDHTGLAWGENTYGDLGDGSTMDRGTPVSVNGLSGVVALAGGLDHSLALLQGGTVWAWGRNDLGQLGVGTSTSSAVPLQVKGLGGAGVLTNVVAIAAGDHHSLALLANGTVLAWSYNGQGQLGNGSTGISRVPVQVTGLSGAVAVAGGSDDSLALLANGTILAWGSNVEGELGNGNFSSLSLVPVAVKDPSGTGALSGVQAIAAGLHSLALLHDGTVLAWGFGTSGQLGNGTRASSSLPVLVSGIGGPGTLSGVAAVSGGFNHSLALLAGGGVVAWGSNTSGQLGVGSFTSSNVPVVVGGLASATAIAAGGLHSLALLADGTVDAWGSNGNGQLGRPTPGGGALNAPTPALVPCPCTPPPSGMTAWWPLDELSGTTATDTIGGYTGNYVGNPVPVPSGEVGPALLVNKSNHVEVPWTLGFPFDFNGGDFTIDAWVLYKSGGSGGELWVVDRGFPFHLGASPLSDSPPHLFYGCGIAFWPSPIPFDIWTHLAVTVTRRTPGGLKQYLNGQLVGQKDTCAYNISFPNVPLGIGGGETSDWNEIDEVEIFHRVLSGSEILAIYNAGAAGKCK